MIILLTLCLLSAFARADEERLLPAFLEEPQDVTAKIGERILLPCKIANAQGGLVQWTRDGFGLGGGRETDFPGIRVIGANPERDWDLEILHLTLEDDTVFECQVTIDNRRSLRSSAKVTVWVPPDPPYINEGPDLTVKESMETTFTCVSRGGKPAPKLDWYDHEGRLMDGASYKTTLMPDGKRFEAESKIFIYPGREHHNSTFRCEAWNEADEPTVDINGDRSINRTPALIHLRVQYAPTVEVRALRPGLIQEGSKAAYRCLASANPPPNQDSFRWFIDNDQVQNQYRDYFEIYNVSRLHHDKQVRCSVANELGTAMGLKSIRVKYAPAFIEFPKTTAGDNLESVTLRCVVDGNPTPRYRWTRGSSREIISQSQNFTVTVTGETVGTYYCHAEVDGYSPITSNPAEILMTGRPNISSNPVQTGVVGDNVHINCAAVTIPAADSIVWKYHQTRVDEENPHYRIINSPIEHGIRSTLVIRQALETDFGPYTCTVTNDHGEARMEILLERQQPLPLQTILIAVFLAVIFVLVLTLVAILFRKKLCCGLLSFSGKKSTANSSMTGVETISPNQKSGLAKVNNFVDQMSASTHQVSTPSESDCGGWGSGDFPDSIGRTTLTRGVAGDQMCSGTPSDLLDPDIPPKPDVISTGYVPYGSSLRDYNPPVGVGQAPESPVHYGTLGPNQNRQSSVLNVSDPRYSATYGNPYLRQANPRPLVPCSSFMNASPHGSTSAVNPNGNAMLVTPPSSSTFASSTSTFQPSMPGNSIVSNSLSIRPPMNLRGGSAAGGLIVSSVPTVISNYGTIAAPVSSSTPNSSVSNMACLPEDPELVAFGEDHTGVPALSPTPNLTQGTHNQLPRLNNSSSGGSGTPSPPNLLPVSQPKVPNLRSPSGLRPQLVSSGDANFFTMPNRSSMASSSVLGVGGPLYHPAQTLNRSTNNNGSALNNNDRSNNFGGTTIMYAPLGVNPNAGGSKIVNDNPTYSTVNKPDLKSDKSGKLGKVSNMGTHV